MSENIERRSVGTQMRAAESDDGMMIVARALTYNFKSALGVPVPGAKERIAPGAFAASIRRGDEVIATFNHDPSQILGRTRNGSLLLADEVSGLDYKVQLNPKVQAHRDLYQLVKDGTISECSFAFCDVEDGWDEEDDVDTGKRVVVRTIKRARLIDVSCVSAPAYPGGTTAVARSFAYAIPSGEAHHRFHPTVSAEQRARLVRIEAEWDAENRRKLAENEKLITGR